MTLIWTLDQARRSIGGMALQDMTERELLDRGAAALKRVEAAPIGSTARAIAWAAYETVKAELDKRALRAVVEAARQLRDH